MNSTNDKISINKSNVNISMPFSKVDVEKRMVHGFATLDNVDSQDDVISYSASLDAFDRFRGNIREMHNGEKAVGKMVSFKPEQLFDPNTGKTYNGVFVSTYVSKGAQDTWEKVLDGTLTGFSIGGVINKADSVYDEKLDKVIRTITSYDLTELSLVDNPANELANVISVEKGKDSTGYLSKTESQNVFYCYDDNVVQIVDDQSSSCYKCNNEMVNIGFVESDDPDKNTVIKGLLSHAREHIEIGDMVELPEGIGRVDAIMNKGIAHINDTDIPINVSESNPVAIIQMFSKNCDKIGYSETDYRLTKSLNSISKMKEAVEVEDDKTPTTETVVEPDVTNTEAIPAEPEVVENTASETVEDKPVDDNKDNDFAEVVNTLKSLVASLEQLPEQFKAIAASVTDAQKSAAQAEETAKSATAELKKAQEENTKLGKRLDAVEQTTAFQKSAVVGDIVQTAHEEEQSFWGGRFLG